MVDIAPTRRCWRRRWTPGPAVPGRRRSPRRPRPGCPPQCGPDHEQHHGHTQRCSDVRSRVGHRLVRLTGIGSAARSRGLPIPPPWMSSTVRLRERVRRGSTPPRDLGVGPGAPRRRHQVRCQDCSPAPAVGVPPVPPEPTGAPPGVPLVGAPPAGAARPMFHRQGPRSARSGRRRCHAPTCFESCSIRCRCRRRPRQGRRTLLLLAESRRLHRRSLSAVVGVTLPTRCPGLRRLRLRTPSPSRSRPSPPSRCRRPAGGQSSSTPCSSSGPCSGTQQGSPCSVVQEGRRRSSVCASARVAQAPLEMPAIASHIGTRVSFRLSITNRPRERLFRLRPRKRLR